MITTTMTAPLYAAGEDAILIADITPAAFSPMPEAVPKGVKLRAIVTDRGIILAWQQGSGQQGAAISRYDIPADTSGMSFRGGSSGGYVVAQGGGCSCGARAVRNWSPFAGVRISQNPRHDLAQTQVKGSRPYGVPPTRYSRSR